MDDVNAHPAEEVIQAVIALIDKFLHPGGMSEQAHDEVLEQLSNMVRHPAPTDLILYPTEDLSYREIAIGMLTYPMKPLGWNP